MILHEWTKVPGSHKDELGQRYTVYECEHCDTTVRYYDTLTWGESIDQAKIKVICAGLMTTNTALFKQPLVMGRA